MNKCPPNYRSSAAPVQQYRKIKVRSFGRCLSCVARHEREAVQFMCLLLYHAGILKSYSMGNKPSVIEATSEGLHVKFKVLISQKFFFTFELRTKN